MTLFFEKKSTPFILAIASKLANFKAELFVVFNVIRWMKMNSGIIAKNSK